MVAGEDQWNGEAVQQVGQQCRVVAPHSVVECPCRLAPVCPPASGRAVQLSGPLRPVSAEIGEQVGPKQLLDAVGVALRAGGYQQGSLVFECVEDAAGVLPPRK